MSYYTLTYSPRLSGWTSYHDFRPEWMVSMNNYMYSFNNGNLYKHNSNPVRNSYYGELWPSKITTIFNNDPAQTKSFKTIATNSTTAWDTNIESDQGEGYIDKTWYDLKEGTWYGYIRRTELSANDISMTSVQGIGNVTTYAASVLTFAFNIGDIISTGDVLYWVNAGVLTLIGPIVAHTANTVSVSVTGTVPTNGSFILYEKNPVAESSPTRGTYLSVEFINDDTTYTEMFMVTSDVFKSYP
ncbi:MAG: Cellulophaga phage phi19:3 [Bacteroidota bacterium]